MHLPMMQATNRGDAETTRTGLSDSSEEERMAVDVADAAEGAEGDGAAADISDAMHNAEDKMCAAPSLTHAHMPHAHAACTCASKKSPESRRS